MQKLVFGTLVLGAFIGLAWPDGEAASDPAGAAAARSLSTSAEDDEPFSSDAPAPTEFNRSENGHFYVNAEVNGELVEFIVDTGASTVALTEDDARRVGLDFSSGEFDVIGEGASGEVRGKHVSLDIVSIEGKKVRDVRGAIIEGGSMSLLGQSYLSRIGGIEMSGDHMVLR